jgi:histone deacetylase 1/2
MLLQELHITLSTAPNLWCDNVSASALASNPVFHSRTKHIKIDYHFVREKVVNHDIQIQHTSTQNQIADVFTKSHTANRYCFLRDKLCVCFLPHSLRGDVRVLNSITTSTKSGT